MSAPTLGTVPRRSWPARELRGVVVSEIRKALSTSAWWALLIPVVLFSLVEGSINPEGDFSALSLYLSLGFATIFAMLFGVVCATAEYRHRTIATSYLVVAQRPRLTVAKMILAAIVGAGYALISTAVTVAGLLISGTASTDELPSLLQAGAGAVLVFALWAMLGVGVGTLIGKRLLAVLASEVYLIVEPIVVMLVDRDGLTTYLPASSADTALGGLTDGAKFGGLFGVAQPWWLMLLVFTGWVVVVGLGGAVAAQRRDIA
jgi:ABC-2 type transport system permease protein